MKNIINLIIHKSSIIFLIFIFKVNELKLFTKKIFQRGKNFKRYFYNNYFYNDLNLNNNYIILIKMINERKRESVM